MYFTKEKAKELTDAMGDPIPYHKIASNPKKCYVLTKDDMENLIKFLDKKNVPKTNGNFVIQAESKDLTKKPIYIRVITKPDNNIQIDYFHPNFSKGQTLTTFVHLIPGGKERECNYFNAVRYDSLKNIPKTIEEKNAFIEMQENNGDMIRLLVLAVLYAMQEDSKNFQKRGDKSYLNRNLINSKCATFIDIAPYVKTVRGKDGKDKKVIVSGYRRYLKSAKKAI